MVVALTLAIAIPASARESKGDARLARIVEANVVATHAYQILLARQAPKADAACYAAGALSDADLKGLVDHQQGLLTSDAAAVRAWTRGAKSAFDPAKDLDPILASGLAIPDGAPVSVMARYLRSHTKATDVKVRSVASLYQTVMEVERDGDLLQQQYALYIALGLPVYIGQLGLAGSDEALLATGRELTSSTCASPFETDPAAWQIAGRKIWNWGEKNLHIRDDRVVAAELLREKDVAALVPRLRAMAPQRIAVVGHSYTMGLHWSSPSSFVPIATDVLRRVNPRVVVRQFAGGGLTASRAEKNFYADLLAWKPDKVLFVVATRTDDDYAALRRMGEGLRAIGAKLFLFDDVHLPASDGGDTAAKAVEVARASGYEVIEVRAKLEASPDRSRFLCLDGIHMTEPYHRLMAKEWLAFLAAGASGARR